METVIESTHIFKDTIFTSYSWIIKASLKSNMTVIWVDTWDFQSGSKAKDLINRYFNFRWHIATVQEINVNLDILQCKNYWKWGHINFACYTHRFKCVKYNGLHKSNTIERWYSFVRQISKLTPLDSRLRKTNHAFTLSSVLIAKRNIKQIVMHALYRDTISTKSSILRNIKSSMKKGAN